MKTVEFFKQLLEKGSIKSLLETNPSLTKKEINAHFNCVFEKCKEENNNDTDFELYTDGASKGNPGDAGIGFVIKIDGETIEEFSEYIGKATNNTAEYTALIRGLERLKELGAKKVQAFSDSELMVKQINKEYSIKNENLKKLNRKIESLSKHFQNFSITHIPRDKNKEADKLSKKGSMNQST